MSKFFKGTLILLIAGFITRIFGFINRIVIARMIGAEGVGLYMMAFPTFILVVTLTQLGLPVAISKRVAEAEANGDMKKVKKILAISLLITGTLAFIFTPLLLIGAPLIAELFFTDKRTMYPLIAITPVIPIIAMSSVIRGYFQGKQNMKPAAFSQILEQTVRILFIILLTKYFLPYGVHMAAAGVMVATILGEFISLVYLVMMFKIKKAFPLRKKFFHLKNGKDIFYELMRIALPTTGGRLIGSVSWFLEPIVVTQSLALAGITTVVATKQYGALTGFSMPLLFLPSFITVALSTALIPSISEAMSLKNYPLVEKRLQQALKITIVTGALPIAILYVLAEPIMLFVYQSKSGIAFIKLMAPFFIFQYLQLPLSSALQALDLARQAMINSLIGAGVKLLTIFVLASRPDFGINGVAIGIVVGFVLVTFLHYATILKIVPLNFYVRLYSIVLLITFMTSFVGSTLFKQLYEGHSYIVTIGTVTLAMTLLYAIFLFLFRILDKNSIKKLWLLLSPKNV
ncbi:stage V sporulation protein B [Fervidibacillus halotolerans]|uniref:Stage V sporulation protein B n=1 Tax=Fervidibacillus halotolerans TaxID=2980027 RepID=A0A9E8RXU4_9BACI|nr:stage V sporulation protein B [Fervidibacillus halotolerans]WAA11564.1 stage V sporulation protein B [Fervidibacillus halotolerans]